MLEKEWPTVFLVDSLEPIAKKRLVVGWDLHRRHRAVRIKTVIDEPEKSWLK